MSPPTNSLDAYKFTGKPVSTTTGLYYYYHRWYDPSIGRFISQDPKAGSLTDPQSLNLYVYVLDRPTALTDPSGLDGGFGADHRCELNPSSCSGPDPTATWPNNHVVQPTVNFVNTHIVQPTITNVEKTVSGYAKVSSTVMPIVRNYAGSYLSGSTTADNIAGFVLNHGSISNWASTAYDLANDYAKNKSPYGLPGLIVGYVSAPRGLCTTCLIQPSPGLYWTNPSLGNSVYACDKSNCAAGRCVDCELDAGSSFITRYWGCFAVAGEVAGAFAAPPVAEFLSAVPESLSVPVGECIAGTV